MEPGPEFDALSREARLVRSLARRMLFDPSLADDVVQQTWLALIEHPPRERDRSTAWFGRVAKNCALKLLRTRDRAARREAAAPPPTPLPSPHDLAEREATIRAVTDALFALPEPYKRTLILRYFDDLPPREIARREAVTVEAIRSRLQRGAAMMRARLDSTHGDDRARFARGIFVVSAPPGFECLRDAAHALVARAAARLRDARLSLVTGALAIVAIATAAWLGGSVSGANPDDSLATPLVAEDQRVPSSLREPAPRTGAPSATPRLEAEDRAAEVLRVRVTRARDGEGARGARVELAELVVPNAYLAPRTACCDADGIAVFEDVEPGPIRLRVEDRVEREFAAEERGPHPIAVTIPLGLRVRGRVVDEYGLPVGNAEVFTESSPARGFVFATKCGADGAFVLEDVPPGTRLFGKGEEHAPTALDLAAGTRGATAAVTLRVERTAASLRGRTVDATGFGTTARVVLITRLAATCSDLALELASDDAGQFVVSGLPAGRTRVIARGPTTWRAEKDVELTAHAVASLDLTLPRGVVAAGRVTRASGAFAAFVRARSIASGPLGESNGCTTEGGEFRIPGLPPATRLEFHAEDGASAVAAGAPDPASESFVDVRLERVAGCTGSIRDARGTPCRGLEVRLIDAAANVVARTATASDGWFRLPHAPEARELLVLAPALAAPIVRCSLTASPAEPLAIVVPDAARSAHFVRGRVEPQTGGPSWIRITTMDGIEVGDPLRTDRDGAFESAALPPGEYRVSALASDGRRGDCVVTVGAGETEGALTLRLAPLVAVTIGAQGTVDPEGSLVIVDSSHDVVARLAGRDLPRVVALAPDRYRLIVSVAATPPRETEFTVEAGVAANVEFASSP